VHALCVNVYFALIPGAVKAAESRVSDEFTGRLFRQVSVTTCNMYSANTKLTDFPMWQWVKLVDL